MADWSDNEPADMSDPVRNIIWATTEMLAAMDEGRYRFEEVHVRADLKYLRGEARRAQRTEVRALADVADEVHRVLRAQGDRETRRKSYPTGVAWRRAANTAAEVIHKQARQTHAEDRP